MSFSQDDRIAISLQIVGADAQVNGLNNAKAQLQAAIEKATKLDTANENLFNPSNNFINGYQLEYNYIDGNVRTTVAEQNVEDAANRKLQNFFFPNDINTSVPSLASQHNVWTKVKPFALNYGIGKNYSEGYGTYTNSELALITLIQSYTPFIPSPPSGTPTSVVIATVNNYIATLNAELLVITSNDPDTTKQTQNNANTNDINTVILPALNAYLLNLNLTTLKTAVGVRHTFLLNRITQLNTNLGTIVQDLTTGEITSSSGLYGARYGFLALRLDALGGSLSVLAGLSTSSGAQDSIISNIKSTKATYLSILPTSLFKAPGNGTNSVKLNDTSFFNAGDTVYVVAEGQEELQRAIKSVTSDTVILNDVIPAKYRPAEKARLYKDLT